MIRQFKEINNVAIYKNFSWQNVPDFKKYNAIYGWNGSGKTVITRILAALEKCDLSKLKIDNNFKCIINIDNTDITVSLDNIPDSFKNRIRVFNEDFVNENLDWEDGRASKILIIGKEQIDQKKKLNELIKIIKNKTDDLEHQKRLKTKKEQEIDKTLEKSRDEVIKELRDVNDIRPKSGRARDYINYTITDVKNILENKNIKFRDLEYKEILLLKESLKEKSAKDPIDKISINLDWISTVENESIKIFNTIIPTGGLQLITELGEDSQLQKWIRLGYEIHREKQKPIECAFCKNIISEQRLQELSNYFSEDLRNLIRNIEDTIIKITSSNELLQINLDKGQFYSEFQSRISDLNNDAYKQIDIIRKELKNLKQRLQEKRDDHSKKIDFNFENINKAKENLTQIISKINDLVKSHNEKSQSFKRFREENAHKLEIAVVSKIKADYDNKTDELNRIEIEIENINNELENLKEQQTELEQKLKEHSFAAEEFNRLLASFLGREEIRLEPVEEGYIIKRNGNIANNLSEGERNAIALIFFLLKLEEEDFDKQNGIVVIDDPVSSFDSQNLYGAFGLIKERLKKIDPMQIFILTHNFPFFRLVKNWMKYETSNNEFYQIKTKIKQGVRYSVIEKIDNLLIENTSEYSYLFKLIYKRANEEDCNLEKDYILPNVIRKFLENYLSFKIPIGKYSSYKKFQKLCKDYPALSSKIISRLNYYCQEQSHPLYQESPIDFDERALGEIQLVCKAVIELVEKTDANHYKYLLNECRFSNSRIQQL